MTLPRVLSYNHTWKRLVSQPMEELAGLRNASLFHITNVPLSLDTPLELDVAKANGAMDLEFAMSLPAQQAHGTPSIHIDVLAAPAHAAAAYSQVEHANPMLSTRATTITLAFGPASHGMVRHYIQAAPKLKQKLIMVGAIPPSSASSAKELR